jgi:hypothetical protein
MPASRLRLSSSNQHNFPSNGGPKAAGAYTLAEIVSQPQCWKSSLAKPSDSSTLERICALFADADLRNFHRFQGGSSDLLHYF